MCLSSYSKDESASDNFENKRTIEMNNIVNLQIKVVSTQLFILF